MALASAAWILATGRRPIGYSNTNSNNHNSCRCQCTTRNNISSSHRIRSRWKMLRRSCSSNSRSILETFAFETCGTSEIALLATCLVTCGTCETCGM